MAIDPLMIGEHGIGRLAALRRAAQPGASAGMALDEPRSAACSWLRPSRMWSGSASLPMSCSRPAVCDDPWPCSFSPAARGAGAGSGRRPRRDGRRSGRAARASRAGARPAPHGGRHLVLAPQYLLAVSSPFEQRAQRHWHTPRRARTGRRTPVRKARSRRPPSRSSKQLTSSHGTNRQDTRTNISRSEPPRSRDDVPPTIVKFRTSRAGTRRTPRTQSRPSSEKAGAPGRLQDDPAHAAGRTCGSGRLASREMPRVVARSASTIAEPRPIATDGRRPSSAMLGRPGTRPEMAGALVSKVKKSAAPGRAREQATRSGSCHCSTQTGATAVDARDQQRRLEGEQDAAPAAGSQQRRIPYHRSPPGGPWSCPRPIPAARIRASDHATMTSHRTTASQTITEGKVVPVCGRGQLLTREITTDGGGFWPDLLGFGSRPHHNAGRRRRPPLGT